MHHLNAAEAGTLCLFLHVGGYGVGCVHVIGECQPGLIAQTFILVLSLGKKTQLPTCGQVFVFQFHHIIVICMYSIFVASSSSGRQLARVSLMPQRLQKSSSRAWVRFSDTRIVEGRFFCVVNNLAKLLSR